MKDLNRIDPTYRMHNLPKLKSSAFIHNGITGYTGSIVKRPLKKGGPFYHYGFTYGFDDQETFFMLENNDYGVECVTWRDFLSEGNTDYEFVHYELEPDNMMEILRRAVERSEFIYEAGHNNCEHFANYCVHGKRESFQADGVKKIADAILSLIEIRILMSPNARDHEFLDQWDKLRGQLKLERNPKAQGLIDKYKKSK